MIDDYFVAVVPTDIDIDDASQYKAMLVLMREEAVSALLHRPRRRIVLIVVHSLDWLVSNSPDEVERFQPSHDCEECRAGNRRAREFLTANPGRHVACANIQYEEIWR